MSKLNFNYSTTLLHAMQVTFLQYTSYGPKDCVTLDYKSPRRKKAQRVLEPEAQAFSNAKHTFIKKCFKIIFNSYFFENKLDNGKKK